MKKREWQEVCNVGKGIGENGLESKSLRICFLQNRCEINELQLKIKSSKWYCQSWGKRHSRDVPREHPRENQA